MQKRVLQGRALLIVWVFCSFFGFLIESAMADDYDDNLAEHKRIAEEDPYYLAQFNPNSNIRLEAVIFLKLEEYEGLIIQKALYDSDSYVRAIAVNKLDSPRYVNLMWEIFWKDDSGYVRQFVMNNLVNNMDTAEKDLWRKEFIEIILDDERCNYWTFKGLNKQTNQDFFYYLVSRYVVENDGYHIDWRCFTALSLINPEEKIKLTEGILNHFANLDEESKAYFSQHYKITLKN